MKSYTVNFSSTFGKGRDAATFQRLVTVRANGPDQAEVLVFDHIAEQYPLLTRGETHYDTHVTS